MWLTEWGCASKGSPISKQNRRKLFSIPSHPPCSFLESPQIKIWASSISIKVLFLAYNLHIFLYITEIGYRLLRAPNCVNICLIILYRMMTRENVNIFSICLFICTQGLTCTWSRILLKFWASHIHVLGLLICASIFVTGLFYKI